MRLFKKAVPLVFECPLCGKVYKHCNWVLVKPEERCRMEQRETTFDQRLHCYTINCINGEVYAGGGDA